MKDKFNNLLKNISDAQKELIGLTDEMDKFQIQTELNNNPVIIEGNLTPEEKFILSLTRLEFKLNNLLNKNLFDKYGENPGEFKLLTKRNAYNERVVELLYDLSSCLILQSTIFFEDISPREIKDLSDINTIKGEIVDWFNKIGEMFLDISKTIKENLIIEEESK